MQYTDEQIQKMLELKESIIDKMAKHQEELDFLQKKKKLRLKKKNQNLFKLKKIRMEKLLPMHL